MRAIARLDIKGDSVIKGISFEGLRKVGDPQTLAVSYYQQGADELLLIDTVATLYGRNNLFHIVERACEGVFVPITVGGGIRTLHDVEQALASGADKVAINSEAIRRPEFVTEIASRFGAQCCVVSIEAKRRVDGWEAYTENGRNPSGLEVATWVGRLNDLGAGEILLTSVDCDGTRRGLDLPLIERVESATRVPVIASGGIGKVDHVAALVDRRSSVSVAVASALHYKSFSIEELKRVTGDEQNPC